MTKQKLSTFEIIAKGYLWVNIPITIIILSIWYLLTTNFNIGHSLGAIIGSAIGWIYWEFTIKKWVNWALDNSVNPDRLLRIGQLSLLLWNRKTIDDVINKSK